MKIFISQPMKDKSKEQILAEREEIIKHVKSKLRVEDITVLDSYCPDNPDDSCFADVPDNCKPLWYLGRSISVMSCADIVVFANKWREYRGCLIEHECAKHYGYIIMYIGDDNSVGQILSYL